MLTYSEKVNRFQLKLLHWQNESKLGSQVVFLRSYKSQEIFEKDCVSNLAREQLNLTQYYLSINHEKYKWIRNPFPANAKMAMNKLPYTCLRKIFEVRAGFNIIVSILPYNRKVPAMHRRCIGDGSQEDIS